MGWGFIDRATAALSGGAGAIGAALGLVKDIATADFDVAKPDKFLTDIYKATQTRATQFASELFGPEEGLGAVVGGLPEHIRSPAGTVLRAADTVMETTYREAAAEPLSTLFTAAQLADSPEYQRTQAGKSRWDKLVDLTTDSYDIAQNRSPGQSLALGLWDVDLWDEEAVAEFAGTDHYDLVSGVADAVLRFTADPSVIGGKAVAVFRTSRFGPSWTIGTGANNLNAAMKSHRVSRFVDEIDGMDAAMIRDRFFPDHAYGDEISYLLSQANSRESRMATLRSLMGDEAALEEIRLAKTSVANQISRLSSNKAVLDDWKGTIFEADNAPQELASIAKELDELGFEQDFIRRAENSWGVVSQVPRVGTMGEVRTAITHSNFYQYNPLGKAVASVFNMRPRGLINLEEIGSDVELSRFIRHSHLSIDEQEVLRNAYISAPNAGARMNVVMQAENQAITSILERTGMSLDEINKHIAATTPPRRLAQQKLNSRTYDGVGRSRMQLNGVDGLTDMPLLVSQTANIYQLPNIANLRRAADRIGTWRGRYREVWGTRPTPSDLMETFYAAWKPLTLLRPAWPMRVISDEQLRIAAKIGAARYVPLQARNLNSQSRAILRRKPVEQIVDEVTGELVPKAVFRSQGFKVGSYDIAAAYGSPGDIANMYATKAQSRGAMLRLAQTEETRHLRELRNSGAWVSIAPNSADEATQLAYRTSFARAANQQIGTDPLAQIFLRGGSQDDALRWLNSGEGTAYRRQIPFRKDLETWVADVEGQVNAYLPHPELRAKALDGTASYDDLNNLVSPDLHPVIHGEVLDQALGKGVINGYLQDAVEKLYQKFAAEPTDALSRHPYFDATYRAEMELRIKRLQDQLEPGQLIDDDTIRLMERQSREVALRDVRDLLYDITAESDLAHTLRFLNPFFAAWQEVITRWTGLSVADPSIAARARLLYNAPSHAGILYDGDGNLINPDGTATDPFGNTVDPADGRFIRFQLPEFAQDWPGMRRDVAINAQSLNMIANGPPGFGPLAQVPVNELVKDYPQLEDNVRFILPFGPSDSWRLLQPTVLQRLQQALASDNDESYAALKIRLFQDETVNYNMGYRDTPPSYEEVSKMARNFFQFSLFAKATLPFSYTFNSPYQFHLDAYRNLMATDPATADERFLEEFGEEFFPLTASITRSMDGIPSTVEGFEARKKYQDLIEKYPEFGRAIIGESGAGEFSRSVYMHQLETPIAPGSDEMQRERLGFETATEAPSVKLGWQKYSKFMDLLDAQLESMGLPNYQVAAAKPLALYKRYMIEEVLSKNYPEWYEEFRTTDQLKWPNRITAIREITQDEKIRGRDEWEGAAQYLRLRDEVSGILAQRKKQGGAGTLSAVSNQDVNAYFQTKVQALIRNPAFSDFYYRYLENDPVEG